jgi:undecaprenyl diphosphate synthase
MTETVASNGDPRGCPVGQGSVGRDGLDRPKMPRHVAIIPDGNRRWAARENIPLAVAYELAERVFFATAEQCFRSGVEWLTFFTFSKENWQRGQDEVHYLIGGDDSLLYRAATRRTAEIHERNIRFMVLGDYEKGIAPNAQQAIRETEELTKNNSAGTLVCAVNYGGQQELVRAAELAASAGLAASADAGRSSALSIESFSKYLYIPEMPPVDLLIRTSGERRISNYMLWHLAYAEIMFLDVLWPDFDRASLANCFEQFGAIGRRYGR